MAQASCSYHHHFRAGVQVSGRLLDRVIGSQTGIGQRRDIFWLKARIELDDGTSIRLQQIGHTTVNRNTWECRVGAVHIVARATGPAESAGDEWVNDHSITNSDIADRRSNFLNPSRVLMTQRVRKSNARLLRPLTLDNMEIGTAQASTPNPHNDIERSANLG